jgi:hypothetical protein
MCPLSTRGGTRCVQLVRGGEAARHVVSGLVEEALDALAKHPAPQQLVHSRACARRLGQRLRAQRAQRRRERRGERRRRRAHDFGHEPIEARRVEWDLGTAVQCYDGGWMQRYVVGSSVQYSDCGCFSFLETECVLRKRISCNVALEEAWGEGAEGGGTLSAQSSKSTTPSDHTSDLWLYGRPSQISGER